MNTYEPRDLLRSLTPSRVMQRVEQLRVQHPVWLSTGLFLGLTAIIAPWLADLWYANPQSFVENTIYQFQGLLLDVLVFGCLLLWIDRRAERRRRIERYQNAIMDYRGWQSDEAMFRTVGNIRRLNQEGVTPDTLRNAFLKDADLSAIDLSGTSLNGASLQRANLEGADLSDAYIGTADFQDANLRSATLANARFGKMTISQNGSQPAFEGANLREADLRGIRDATANTFRGAKTLYKARMDDELRAHIEQTFPDLLEPLQPKVPQASRQEP